MLLETIKALVARHEKRKPAPVPKNAATTTEPSTSVEGLNPTTDHHTQPSDQPTLVSTAHVEGLFPYASNLYFNHPTMISNTIDAGTTVIQILADRSIPGAEVDSSARDPPPKCHPETRKSLRDRINTWCTKRDRDWRMLWILGSAGVGKSAVAQTIGEEFKASGRLGAAVFFSRPQGRNDPDCVVATIAYQLAVKHPQYKRIITQRLADDPKLLERNRRTQFKDLIVDPFQVIMTRHSSTVPEPVLIILDGLDECKGEEAQCEFIELISDHVRTVPDFPLLWMICSRPEWHLKDMLSHPDFQITCMREEIVIDESESRQDVEIYLGDGFRDIRRRFRDQLDDDWPLDKDVRQIADSASGLFALASTVIRFVGDTDRSDPDGQLRDCLKFLSGSRTPRAINPLHTLDLLYRRILSRVPAAVLPTARRILGMSILYPATAIQASAMFLCIDRPTFYRSLNRLHSVLNIPRLSDAHQAWITFHHASFRDYLTDQGRSGSFYIEEATVYYDVAVHTLQWLTPGTRPGTAPIAAFHECSNLIPTRALDLKWPTPETQDGPYPNVDALAKFSGWRAFTRITDADTPKLLTSLEQFDFGSLQHVTYEFAEMVRWLYSLGTSSQSLIHIAVDCPAHHSKKKLQKALFLANEDELTMWKSTFGPGLHQTGNDMYTITFHLGTDDKVCEITMTLS